MRWIQPMLAAGLVALVGLALGCNSKSSPAEATKTVTETVTVSEPKVEVAKIGPGAPTRRVEFGHIESLKQGGGGYVLRFDPAAYLTGVTASDAMQEDTGSSDVPNDNYVVDEAHRLFTYNVPADAHVTVLADGVDGTPITVAQLAKIVKGGEPLGHPLFEPLDTGVWILYEVDTVRSMDQQYVP